MRSKIAYKNKLALILAGLTAFIFLCGFSFGKVYVTLDMRDYTLYREMSAEEIFDALAANKQSTKDSYDNEYCAVFGKLTAIAKDGRSFEIAPVEGFDSKTIHCILNDSFQGEFPSAGNPLYVLGKMRISLFGAGSCSMEADGLRRASSRLAQSETYLTLNGDNIRPDHMSARVFGKDSITKEPIVRLAIPKSFEAVEEELPEQKDQPKLDGYLYRLNELEDTRSSKPEQFYIFWFDNEKQLLDQNDKNRSQDIARAIIRNILPGENIRFGRFPVRRTVYGNEYIYYDTAYTGYNAEFVFKPCGDDGLLCMLYVYRNSDHKKDILSIFRFVE